MKTQGKLTFIVTITGAILFPAASFLMWNSIAVYRKINTVTPSLQALRLLTYFNQQRRTNHGTPGARNHSAH